MVSQVQLLQTKFLPPAINPKLLKRDHLLLKLTSRVGRKLVLITAPAGYGKTTLANQWLETTDSKYCWLSLDQADNHSQRFWSYLVGAIASKLNDFGKEARSFLDADTPHYEACVTAIVNELTEYNFGDQKFIIALDDFHHIEDVELLNQIAYLVDFLPQNVEIIATTRYMPKLPISRWSVKNWVDQLSARELIFSFDESKRFLNEFMGLSLNDSQIDSIFSKTQGWIAALQLTALSAGSFSESEQRHLSTEKLLADEQHLTDYILSEVLFKQPDAIQSFLLHTSCLIRLNAQMCNDIMGIDDAPTIIQTIYNANLFLVPLDKDHRWFKFHDMFREALCKRFKLNHEKEYIETQKKAVDWLIENNQAHEAIEQVLQLEDWDSLITLLEQNGNNLIHEGHHLLVLQWLRKLPESLFSQSPRAIMLKIWALFFSNKIEVISPLLDELELLIDQQRLSNVETSTSELIDLHSEISLIRAYLARSHSDLKSAGQLTKDVLKELDTTKMPLKSVTYYGLGLDSFAIGDLESAETALIEAIQHGKREKKYTTVLSSSGLLGWIYFYQGKLEKALETGIVNQQWIDSYHDSSQPRIISCWQNCALTLIYSEKAEFTIAKSYINPLLKHLEMGTEPGQHIIIQYTRAFMLFSEKKFVDAIECIDDAHHVYTHKKDSIVFTPPSLISLKARCLIAMGKIENAQAVINEIGKESINAIPLNYEDINLTKARILIAQKDFSLAHEILDRLESQTNTKKHTYHLIQTLNLKAIVYHNTHEKVLAENEIKKSLQIASQDGFISVYANESEQMLPVLALGADPAIPDNYLQKLTSTLGVISETRKAQQVELPGVAALESNKQLLEPLSSRELEVLKLIDQGLANKEIAQKLSLAPATVKAHIRNLYGKIEAKSRTEALSKARAIGLL